jgi:hypothetical protein
MKRLFPPMVIDRKDSLTFMPRPLREGNNKAIAFLLFDYLAANASEYGSQRDL